MQPDAPAADSPQPRCKRLRRVLSDKAVEEPWRVTTFVWQALKAALLPISLRDVPRLMGRFLEHLKRSNVRCRERQAAAFTRHLQEMRA